MRQDWIRRAANAVVFGGWMLPLLLAQRVPEATAQAMPAAVRALRIIGGVWAFAAVGYGLILAIRLRRGIAN